MGGKFRKKCDGHVLCCPLNPLGYEYDCLTCPKYSGPKPEPPRSLPGYKQFTAWDNPPPETSIESVCPVCGKLFFAPQNKHYCSLSCKKKAYKRRRFARGNQNRHFPEKVCVVCGKRFEPHTDNQQTCGGNCTKKYFAKKYGRGLPKNHPLVQASAQRGSQEMMTRNNCPVQQLKECVEQIKRHNPNATITPSSLDALASLLAARLSWWRSLSRTRQAVLLDVAVTYGVHGLLSMDRLLRALRAGKWEQARQAMLNSKYASLAGKGAVENARQLSTGAWTIIPDYIPEDDEEDESDTDYRFF